jgi:tetratricopeptide (TPR) repeat protein
MRAIDDHNKAIVLDPGDAIAYASRGETYEAQGDFKKAIEDYNKGLSVRARSDLEKERQARRRAGGHRARAAAARLRHARTFEDISAAVVSP